MWRSSRCPRAEVPGAAEQCGRRGVHALVVITAGFDRRAGAELLGICRRYGMRLVGPNCFGVINTTSGLNATFTAAPPRPAPRASSSSPAASAWRCLSSIDRLGIGVSSFASVGDKYDVSSNDMLTWWDQDDQTTMAVLYVESFGNPRQFAHTARRVGEKMPVLTVIGGRSAAGQLAAASQPAASATPLVTQEALFGQAASSPPTAWGSSSRQRRCCPVSRGQPGRIAIVSSAAGAGVLAADACVEAGLQVAVLGRPPAAAGGFAAARRRRCRTGRYHGRGHGRRLPGLPGGGCGG